MPIGMVGFYEVMKAKRPSSRLDTASNASRSFDRLGPRFESACALFQFCLRWSA